MSDVLDLETYDPVVLGELMLTADLMIMANTTERHLTEKAIDEVCAFPGVSVVCPYHLKALRGGERHRARRRHH